MQYSSGTQWIISQAIILQVTAICRTVKGKGKLLLLLIPTAIGLMPGGSYINNEQYINNVHKQ
jgi:uncharacterized membrane protein